MFGLFRKRPTTPAASTAQPAAFDGSPPGEVEKLMKVKHLCWIAKMSAESLVDMSASGTHDEETLKYETDRYRKFSHDALDVAREITDEFYRDSALHMLIDLFMAAKNEGYAKKLFGVITVDMIRDKLLEAYPRLGAQF